MSLQQQLQQQKHTISLKGSAQIVSEFFQFAVNKCDLTRPAAPVRSGPSG